MKCSHPFLRLPLFPWEKAPRDLKVRNGAVLLKSNKVNYEYFQACLPPNLLERLQEVPCGKCMSCRINLAEQWASRCALELKDHSSAYFVTLTYDDDHLRYAYRINARQRTCTFEPTLVKRDAQLFIKRLRKYCAKLGIKLRYFGCGEYGSTTQRPHYHFIFFGMPFFADSKLLNVRSNGSTTVKLYSSPTLESLWSHGHVAIGDVTYQSISYVARYTTKKFRSSYLSDEDREFYDQALDELNSADLPVYEDDFLMMSRNPGIGRSYFDKNFSEIYRFDRLIYSCSGSNVKVLRPLRYYDRLYDFVDPEHFHQIKLKRFFKVKRISKLEPKNTLSYFDKLAINEKKAVDCSCKLIRSL